MQNHLFPANLLDWLHTPAHIVGSEHWQENSVWHEHIRNGLNLMASRKDSSFLANTFKISGRCRNSLLWRMLERSWTREEESRSRIQFFLLRSFSGFDPNEWHLWKWENMSSWQSITGFVRSGATQQFHLKPQVTTSLKWAIFMQMLCHQTLMALSALISSAGVVSYYCRDEEFVPSLILLPGWGRILKWGEKKHFHVSILSNKECNFLNSLSSYLHRVPTWHVLLSVRVKLQLNPGWLYPFIKAPSAEGCSRCSVILV